MKIPINDVENKRKTQSEIWKDYDAITSSAQYSEIKKKLKKSRVKIVSDYEND